MGPKPCAYAESDARSHEDSWPRSHRGRPSSPRTLCDRHRPPRFRSLSAPPAPGGACRSRPTVPRGGLGGRGVSGRGRASEWRSLRVWVSANVTARPVADLRLPGKARAGQAGSAYLAVREKRSLCATRSPSDLCWLSRMRSCPRTGTGCRGGFSGRSVKAFRCMRQLDFTRARSIGRGVLDMGALQPSLVKMLWHSRT